MAEHDRSKKHGSVNYSLAYKSSAEAIRKALATVCVLVTLGCEKPENTSFNYKLTAEIETPEGLRTGSSVLKVVVRDPLAGTEGLGGGGLSARGEAVSVDLPNGKTLFVLLRSTTNVDWGASAFVRARDNVTQDRQKMENTSTADYIQTLKSDRRVYTVPRWTEYPNGDRDDNYPMLVIFQNASDPKSVEVVNSDDLAATFGQGFRFKTLTVQITDDAVSDSIVKRLPNYGPETRFDKWYKNLPYGDPRAITKNDFSRNAE